MAKPSMSLKSKPMEMEPGEGKKHEMAETKQEEVREGAEPDDMPKGKTNRKRSAKGAKNTKAPMDGEGCACGARKGKASCDGNCGGYGKKMDRNDALTPQEYLAACDLGIQNRSRTYIRARLDAAERLDLKCGKGSISQGEKCSKGAATRVENALKIGGTLGAIGALGAGLYQGSKGNYKGAHPAFAAAHGFSALSATGTALQGKRTGNKAMQKTGEAAVAINAALAGSNLGVTRSKLYSSPGSSSSTTGWSRPPASSQSTNQTVQRVTVREIPNEQPRLTGSTIQQVKVREISSIPLQYEGRSIAGERRIAQQALAGYSRRRTSQRPRVGVSTAPRVTGSELGLNGSDYFGRSYEPGALGVSTERIRTPRRLSSRQSVTKDSVYAPGFSVDYDQLAL